MMAAAAYKDGIPLAELLPDSVLPGNVTDDGIGTIAISGLTLDSRAVQPGHLFCAVPGGEHDGRCFMAQAEAAGCAAIAAEDRDYDRAAGGQRPAVPVIRVPDLAARLSAIGHRFYGEPSAALAVTGITGTNGKTTCSHLLAQVFDATGHKAAVIGTLGYGLVAGNGLEDTGMTTPDALATQRLLAELRDRGAGHVAMEVSSHSLDQQRVAAVHFNTAVFTNLSRDHLDYHGDEESYGAAKARLFALPGLESAVINSDEVFGRSLLAGLPARVKAISYGLDSNADVTAEGIRFQDDGIRARVLTPWGEGDLDTGLLGEYNLLNLLAVIAAACAQGLDLEPVLAAMPTLKPVPGRLEVVAASTESRARPRVVVDYAHTPDALDKTLAALRRHCAGRLWCVFGCGGDRDPGKRPLMGAVAESGADEVILTSDNPRREDPEAILRAIAAGMDNPGAVIADRRLAIREAIAGAGREDIVLIAGKGHEQYQLVGGDRLPFSDITEARLALAAIGGEGA